ncbi:MAG: precorrin-6A reductase [Desulfosporosinus sp.]|nr:precorrin-6A reductase [Desulfosporosinus sp.]
MRLLVLAGTEDGRALAEALKQRGYDILVSTLTAYGADLALEQGLQTRSGAMDAQLLTNLLEGGAFAALVDATHPYAVQVKEVAKTVCEKLSLPYLRWQRSPLELEVHPLLHWADDIPAAAQIAVKLGGQRILLTTGSNGLPEWISQSCLQDKTLYIRVLPTAEVLERCQALGFKPYQIIAAQGPFSQAWDEAMFKQLTIDIVVAKESGKVGGTLEKVQACLSLNIPLIILKRPATETQACSLAQFIKHLEEIIWNQRSFS